MPRKSLTIAERFWSNVRRTPGCWIWTGAVNENGYGVLSGEHRGDKQRKAHRVAYELAHGVILEARECVMHTCDHPLCVRPSHLRKGTVLENNRDMVAKGRNYKGGPRKLTENDVRRIRRALETRSAKRPTRRKLARRFRVTISTIRSIAARRTWRAVA